MKQVSLRMSEELYEELQSYVARTNLSINGAIIQSIQKLLETDDIKRRLSDLESQVAKLQGNND